MEASQMVLVVKNPPANARDSGWIPGLAKFPGEGIGYPLQYSCLENLMDRGTWWATLYPGHEELDMTWQLHNNNSYCRICEVLLLSLLPTF